jgi:antitoxin (DNA-binding transcriptional repressor) of toxin-antitoxin stability system
MQRDIHEAKTQSSKLAAAVECDEVAKICRSGRPVIDCVPAAPLGAFPFGAWGSLPGGAASLDHMVGPTDGGTPGDMEL